MFIISFLSYEYIKFRFMVLHIAGKLCTFGRIHIAIHHLYDSLKL